MLIKCAKCGFENQMGAIFCRGCGEKIDMNAMDPDTVAKNQKKGNSGIIGKIIRKIFLILIIVALVGAVASFFVSYRLPVYKAAPSELLKDAEVKVSKIGAEKLTSLLPDTAFTMDEINILLKKRFFGKSDAVATTDEKAPAASADSAAKTEEKAPAASSAKSKSKEIIDNIRHKFVVNNVMVSAAGANMKVVVFSTAFGYIPLRIEFTGTLLTADESAALRFEAKSGRIGYCPVPGNLFNKYILKKLAPEFRNEEMERILKRAKTIELEDGKLKLSFPKENTNMD
ncbi:MAG: zinc ribbon domain-containing protein [Lentisphaeria bacterium]|nr:zinc ribbon domain-containing protein [Lentisphaeria bacterium]